MIMRALRAIPRAIIRRQLRRQVASVAVPVAIERPAMSQLDEILSILAPLDLP